MRFSQADSTRKATTSLDADHVCTVLAVSTTTALSHWWLANFQKAGPIIAHSIIGPTARLPIQWLRVLLQLIISQKGGGYYNRAALIRLRKSLQRIRTFHEMKFIAMRLIPDLSKIMSKRVRANLGITKNVTLSALSLSCNAKFSKNLFKIIAQI